MYRLERNMVNYNRALFWKWFFLARNRVNNTTDIFEMRLTIKIQNTPRSGLEQ